MTNRNIFIIAFLIIVVSIAIRMLFLLELLSAKSLKILKCTDFITQADAQKAYNKGAKQLDGFPKNGLACDSSLK